MKTLGPVLFGVCAALCIGCNGSDQDLEIAAVEVHDSAGVTIIQNGALDLNRSILADSVPALRIGAVEGSKEYQLFRVSDVKRLSDGSIVVANAGNRELRIYSRDGTYLATAGGPGPGPREFSHPRALVILPGDTIQVQDKTVDRVYYTADGTFIRRETADVRALFALRVGMGGLEDGQTHWTADGRYFISVLFNPVSRPQGAFRPRTLYLRVSPDLALVDTLGEFGGPLVQMAPEESEISFIAPPFGATSTWSLGSVDGAVVIGDNAAPQVDVFHPDGNHSIVRWTAQTQAVTTRDIETWKDRQRITRNSTPARERLWSLMDVPPTKPFYASVKAGSDGSLWLKLAEDGGNQIAKFIVFDRSGHYLGNVDLPGRFVVYDAGHEWVLGIARDDNDVEYVQMYKLSTALPTVRAFTTQGRAAPWLTRGFIRNHRRNGLPHTPSLQPQG